jgi:hypothetical protein
MINNTAGTQQQEKAYTLNLQEAATCMCLCIYQHVHSMYI